MSRNRLNARSVTIQWALFAVIFRLAKKAQKKKKPQKLFKIRSHARKYQYTIGKMRQPISAAQSHARRGPLRTRTPVAS